MAEYTIRVSTTVQCALHIEGVAHPDSETHGRSMVIAATFAGEQLDEHGFLRDERRLRSRLETVTSDLDHAYLNRLPQFAGLNPSGENIARWVAERLQELSPPADPVRLVKVSVELHRDARVTYRL